MTLNDDRIDLAYKGKLGDNFAKKTRERINWIVKQVKGDSVLDIGTSQGTIPIILGREGKKIEAIDINEEAIIYANQQLETEHDVVKQNIQFRVANFMTDNQLKDTYDSIILTEVLEHIADTDAFLSRIKGYLSDKGQLIVTVPFGINEYPDHKDTYYFQSLKTLLGKYFTVDDISYLGDWVGVICSNKHAHIITKEDKIAVEQLIDLENAFFEKEKMYIQIIQELGRKDDTVDHSIIPQLTTKLSLDMISSILKAYAGNDFNYRELLDIFSNNIEDFDKVSDELYHQQLMTMLKKTTIDFKCVIDREKQLLNELEKVNNDNNRLKSELFKLKKTYTSLRQSKLGKIQAKYWKIRKKFR
jgi:2-polyprenyl-3-methyl-5-hydroxy-6-metoxy-1,4-benzoquinol methylase